MKKIISLLMVLVLCFCALPIAVSAQTDFRPIYVGGIEMNDGDYLATGATTTTKTRPSTGYAYYKEDRLLLNNFSYEGLGYVYNEWNSYMIYSERTASLSIEIVSGTTNVFNTGNLESLNAYNGICVAGSLSIVNYSNGGSLEIYANKYGIESGGVVSLNNVDLTIDTSTYGIDSESFVCHGGNLVCDSYYGITTGDFDMRNGTVTVDATQSIFCSNYTQTGGTVNALANDYALSAYEINISGGELTAIAEEQDAITASNGITISNGIIYADAYYYAILCGEKKSINISGGKITLKARFVAVDENSAAFRKGAYVNFDENVVIKASENVEKELGEYDSSKLFDYDYMYICRPYNITVNGGGYAYMDGVGKVTTACVGDKVRLIPTVPYPEGKTFSYWHEEEHDTIVSYENGAYYFTMIDTNLTFEAIWKSMTSIAVTTNPYKTVYNAGEFFDPTGMKVTAYFDDGSSELLPDNYYTYQTSEITNGQTHIKINANIYNSNQSVELPITVYDSNVVTEVKFVTRGFGYDNDISNLRVVAVTDGVEFATVGNVVNYRVADTNDNTLTSGTFKNQGYKIVVAFKCSTGYIKGFDVNNVTLNGVKPSDTRSVSGGYIVIYEFDSFDVTSVTATMATVVEDKYLDEIEVEVDSNANYVFYNVNCYLCDDDGNIERTVGYDHQFLKDRIYLFEIYFEVDGGYLVPSDKAITANINSGEYDAGYVSKSLIMTEIYCIAEPAPTFTLSGIVTSFIKDEEVFIEVYETSNEMLIHTETIIGTINESATYSIGNLKVGNYKILVYKAGHKTFEGYTSVYDTDVVYNMSLNVIGDVNADSKINVVDVVRLKKYFANDETIYDELYDVDGDLSITTEDLVALRKMLLAN